VGSSPAALAAANLQRADPWGIRIALRPGHPLALLNWQQYVGIVWRVSRTVEQQLQGPALEALLAFNRERRRLVRAVALGWCLGAAAAVTCVCQRRMLPQALKASRRPRTPCALPAQVQELTALRQQLEPEVELPQLQPLRDETEALDEVLGSLAALQDAHTAMLAQDMGALDLEVLELKLKLKLGADAYAASPVAPAVQRLKQLHGRVQAGERLPVAAVTQLDVDLKTLAAHAEQQRQLEQVVSVNIQRHEAALFARLAQLQSAGAGGDASRQATAV
jgi:hypothetical protein